MFIIQRNLSQVKIAVIDVAKYVASKFRVFIETVENFTFEDEKIPVVIRTECTDGRSLSGLATITVFEDFDCYACCKRLATLNSKVVMKKSLRIIGQETVELNLRKILNFDKKNETILKINVDIIEDFTGLVESTSEIIFGNKDKYKISLNLNQAPVRRGHSCPIKVSFF